MSKTIHELEFALNSRAPNKQELVLSIINSEEFDVTQFDRYGKTPLHLVALHKNTEAIRVLVGKGADMEAEDNYARTPLYFAASSMDSGSEVVESVRALLELGADSGISLRGIMPGPHFAMIKAAQAIDKILAESYVSRDDKCDIQVDMRSEDAESIVKRTKTIFAKIHGEDLSQYPAFLNSVLEAIESIYNFMGFDSPSERAKLCPVGKALNKSLLELVGDEPSAAASSSAVSALEETAESDPTGTEGGGAQSHPPVYAEGGAAQSHPDPAPAASGAGDSLSELLGAFAAQGWGVPGD